MRPVRTQTGTTNYDTSKFALDRYKSNNRLHVTGTISDQHGVFT